MSVLTITTDFGGPSGAMKGVIWGISPETHIADLSWGIKPQNLLEAAFVLDRQVYFFPENTVHVVVVDPGVGTNRRPLAAKIGPYFYVAPDNGVLTPMYQQARQKGWEIKVVHTNKPEYWLPRVSNIFHGRDIFAPVGAHLAAGVALEDLGEVIDDPVLIDLPVPQKSATGVSGIIAHIYDHFGNIITNIKREDLAGYEDVNVSLCGITIEGLVNTFGERPVGTLVALYDANDHLYVSVVNGSAAKRIHANIGDAVEVAPR